MHLYNGQTLADIRHCSLLPHLGWFMNTVNHVIYSLKTTENWESAPTDTCKYCFLPLFSLKLTWYLALKITCSIKDKHQIPSEVITQPQWSSKSHPLCLLFLMAFATSHISTAVSLSSKISEACELSQPLFCSCSCSLCPSVWVWVYWLSFSTKPMNLSALCGLKWSRQN